MQQPIGFRVLERDEASLPEELFEQQKVTKRKALTGLIAIIVSGIVAGHADLDTLSQMMSIAS